MNAEAKYHSGIAPAIRKRTTIWWSFRFSLLYIVQIVKFVTTEVTGFEPAVSSLTGKHVRPLHHTSTNRVNNTSQSAGCQVVCELFQPVIYKLVVKPGR